MSKNKLKLASVALATLTATPAFAQGAEALKVIRAPLPRSAPPSRSAWPCSVVVSVRVALPRPRSKASAVTPARRPASRRR